MTVEDILAEAESAARSELLEAEAALLAAEAAARVAREELNNALVQRATLREVLDQVGKDSPSAPRLVRRLHDLRHAEGPHTLATANVTEAKRRVERLKAELAEMERLAAPPEPAEAEDVPQEDTVVH